MTTNHIRDSWMCLMPGPSPTYRPCFPLVFLEQARQMVRQRTIKFQLRQRAVLVLRYLSYCYRNSPCPPMSKQDAGPNFILTRCGTGGDAGLRGTSH
jgi:hypothetical protein